MASPAVLTPTKGRVNSLFSTRTAGGRMPLTPSPQTPTRTPIRDVPGAQEESIHGANLMSRFTRSISKPVKDSPKSNIALQTNSPRRLDLGVSDWTLTGTGSATAKQTPSRARKDSTARPGGKSKVRLAYKD